MNFNESNLLEEAYFSKIKKQAEEYITFDMFREAFDLSRDLEKALSQNIKIKSPNFYAEYFKIIIKLKWVGLHIMKEKNIIDLFQNHFTKIYGIDDYDVWGKTKTVLISIVVLEDRNKLKAIIRKALMNNKERITRNKILINNEEKEPTVENWIVDYNRNLGVGVVDKLKLSQYLINGENIKKLDENEKRRIKILFSLFERLKLSSLTLEGVEEEIPIDEEYGYGVIVRGIPEFYKEDSRQKKFFEIAEQVIKERDSIKIKKEESGLAELEQAVQEYPVGSLERKAIEEEIKRMNSES